MIHLKSKDEGIRMNSDAFQWIMIAIFGFLAIYMAYINSRIRSKIIIKDQRWTFIRIIVVLITILSTLELLKGFSSLILLRYFVTIIACLIFFLSHDGVSEQGVIAGTNFTKYQDVHAYDIYDKGKKVILVLVIADHKDKEEMVREIIFEQDKRAKLETFLKEKIGRKYRRMRRN